MTTIVVVKKNNQVVIAADSLITFGEVRQPEKYDCHSEKIQKVGDSYLSIVGSAAHTLVLDSVMRRKDFKASFSSRESVFDTFLKMHKLLKDEYYLNPKDEDDDPYESSRIDALIASPQGIFSVYALREVYEYKRFWALGSGSEFALGAMFACYDELDDAAEIAAKGVAAGAEFNVATALPMSMQTITLKAD